MSERYPHCRRCCLALEVCECAGFDYKGIVVNGEEAVRTVQKEHRAALASKDAEIERLRAIVGYFDTFFPDAFPADEEMGFDVESVVRPLWGPNRAAGATPHPRSEVSGSEIPGNHSDDPE